MADLNPVGGLKWVKGEIVADLKRVRAWLESLVDGRVDSAACAEALTALNEVRGVLLALELATPARLAEEMRALAEALAAGSVSSEHEAAEALMLALVQLPDYLDKRQAGYADAPLVFLPSINELRVSRGVPLLSEVELLVPASSLMGTEISSPEIQKALGGVAAKIRPHFHRYLLQWFRSDSSHQGLLNLGRLFQQLRLYIHTGIFHELFLAAEAVVEALADGSLPTDSANKALIGHLDRVIKSFAEDTQAWPEADAQNLLINLLARIATCDSSSYLVTELKTAYGLKAGADAGHLVSSAFAPGPLVLSELVAEARKDLVPIKDSLDLYSRAQREDPGQLLELEPKLRSLANTLTVTGADELVDRLRRCANQLGAMGRGTVPAEDQHLMAVAEELLAVESELAELGGAVGSAAPAIGKRELLTSTLREARVEIVKVKEAIASLVGGGGDVRVLRGVPDPLQRVVGALRMLGESDAADALDLIVAQIRQRYIAANRHPPAEELDLLAQAISGVEIYTDGLREGESFRRDVLVAVREAIQALASRPTMTVAHAVKPQVVVPPVGGPAEPEAAPPAQEEAGTVNIDPEFLEIFLEEAEEEEESIRGQFARWSRDGSDDVALTVLRRSFHTLKGSGRLVGAKRVSEFARSVEMLLNRVIDATLKVSPEIMAFMGEAVALLPELITAEADGRPLDIREMVARAESLTEPKPADELALQEPLSREPAKVIPWPATSGAFPRIEAESRESAPENPSESPSAAEVAEDPEAMEAAALAEVDEELLDIFRTEAREHVDMLRSYVETCSGEASSPVPDDSLVRALHTLTGSARMTGIPSIAETTRVLERLFQIRQNAGSEPEHSEIDFLRKATDALELRLEHLPALGSEIALLRELAGDAGAWLSRVEEGERTIPAPEPDGKEEAVPASIELAEIEAKEGLPYEGKAAEELPSEAEILSGGIAETSQAEPEVRQRLPENEPPVQEAKTDVPSEAEVAEEVVPPAPPAAPPAYDELPSVGETLEAAESALPDAKPAESTPEVGGGPAVDLPAKVGEELPDAATYQQLPEDSELLGLFLEDARDMLDKLDQSLRELQLAPTSSEPVEELQRVLHTLKGSARLSGLSAIGDLSHAFESLLTAISHGEARVDDDALELAQRSLDALSDQVDAVERRAPLPKADGLVHGLALVLEKGLAGTAGETPSLALINATPALRPPPAQRGPEATAEVAAEAKALTTVPQIRVRSDLLNRLVNDAGEISIYRARLSQNSGVLGFRLGELDQTVDRLREQLRKMEIETEAQIMHRFERDTDIAGRDREDFDPLELDRFSTLQQLSRSLAETVNDLASLRDLLGDLQAESDTLLMQQARIADDLQDGLLRTRMVPFVQLVPRLHRVVRQTAQQMGKEAKLEVFGPEVELDRGIQDRIVAPLEHLLRNSVAHGIEMPEERVARDKPRAGVISLILNREGNDVVITVADDGAGLDLTAIRQRAVEQGLLEESTRVGDDELAQIILESGFSTAREVTQIAGRGVGLDVVNAEVKQLSGSFALDTQPGRGTSFTIRLPLTLAIIEALLVDVGGEVYAIPHATIEAASRISREDLEACYRGERTDFAYGGRHYRVVYLAAMLQRPDEPDLGERRFLPLLLARAGDQRVALHVDNLFGTQRIVVKSLGPQLSTIRWLSGGTILPNGKVALILDPLALIRSGAMHEYRPPTKGLRAAASRRACVMVVDDSLTVRRVTSRMLQRQNMDVITAQDGIEALTLLEERIPDVMLLDIEMPRMDGYELTRHIRRSERFKHIPLIMITSRTGEKHRRRAMELGVDRYLGKPYQEADLLDEISSVLAEVSL